MTTRCRSSKPVPQGWGMTEYLRSLKQWQSFVHKGNRNGLYSLAKQARIKIKTRRLRPDSVTGEQRYHVWRIK
jgi:hypothetical protein